MKVLAILGVAVAVPVFLIAALAGLGLLVFALAVAPLLVAFGMLSAAAYEFEQALHGGWLSSKRASAEAHAAASAEAHAASRALGRMLAQR